MISRALGAAVLLACLGLPGEVSAYSVLAHQAIIDAAWERSLVPALRARYSIAAADLPRARAFAYGGSLIQDIGYYPFSSRFFGDLTHYVRSGDFVEALVREAADPMEYAFALGALPHYAADNNGHPRAVNRAVPLVYPKLLVRYGPYVTYAQSPSAHLKTEFGFDVLQVARGHYVSDAYHDFIGFEVAKGVLDRACKATYGLELDDLFGAIDVSIGTFRWTVSQLIPEATKVAWDLKQEEIRRRAPATTRERFLFQLTRANFEEKYGREYKRPGWGHRILALLFRILPKFGPFRPLAFEPPTPEAERLFADSFITTVARYQSLIDAAARTRLTLDNLNFDTGRMVRAGDYPLVDKTYERLLARLADRRFEDVPAPLRMNVLAFYAEADAPLETKKHRKRWKALQRHLAGLKNLKASPE